MRQIKNGWFQVALVLGAVGVLGACNSEPRFGPGCEDGSCAEMLEVTDDLMDQVEVFGSDGERPDIALPEEGERIVFSGTVLPQGGSSEFSFEGRAGQWVSIEVYSRGVLDPTFRVEALVGLERWSLRRDGESGMARRVMVLPEDRLYDLEVFSGIRNERDLQTLGDRGGEDAHFVGVIETIAAPTARPLEVNGRVVEERFINEERGFFEVRNPSDAPVGVRVESFHDDGHPIYGLNVVHGDLLGSEPGAQLDATPVRYEPVLQSLIEPSRGTHLHVDTETHTNTHGWYRIAAHALSAFAPGEQLRAQTSGQAGQIVTAYHRNWTGEPAAIEVLREGEVIFSDEFRSSVGQQSTRVGPADMAFYLDEAASFEAVLTNSDDTALYNAEVDFDVKEPVAVWEVSPDDRGETLEYEEAMKARHSEYVVLDVRERTLISVSVSGKLAGDGPASVNDMDVYVYAIEDPAEPLDSAYRHGYQRLTLDPGRYLLQAAAYAPQRAGFWLSAEFSAPE